MGFSFSETNYIDSYIILPTKILKSVNYEQINKQLTTWINDRRTFGFNCKNSNPIGHQTGSMDLGWGTRFLIWEKFKGAQDRKCRGVNFNLRRGVLSVELDIPVDGPLDLFGRIFCVRNVPRGAY